MPVPSELGPTWNALQFEIVAVHERWVVYKQLFDKSDARTEFLLKTAGHFFVIIHLALIDDVQLTLGKLGDSPKNRQQQNATLKTLLQEIQRLNLPALTAALEAHLDVFERACRQIRTRRHKQIAHYDYKTLLERCAYLNAKRSDPPIPAPTKEEIETALKALRDFMHAIEHHFENSETLYDDFIATEAGDDLVWRLKQGIRYEDLMRNEKIPWEDMLKTVYWHI